ncbi:MAG TPA: AMP-binding protein [Ktedonobacteraceae bacterium]
MFATGARQFRMAMSMVWGTRINPRNVERLVRDALQTLEEFGEPGDDVQQVLQGPFTDPNARKTLQNGAIQRTAKRLARSSPYYKKLFASHEIAPEKLTVDLMPRVPVTRKQALLEQQQEFITTDSRTYISTRTTGTTGNPAEIWLSHYEFELCPAFSALSGLLRNEISPKDCMQINISSRATAAVQQNLNLCRLVGARTRVLGIIPPEESLNSLLTGGDEAPTLLSTYPSYLAQLVQAARKRGLGPSDFHLRRVDCGGEVLSSTLIRAAKETLGPAIVADNYQMTEILPVSARACSQRHLHHDLNIGFVEVIDLETGEPAEPGALGSLVVTPYFPYRECMPVFRYDTRDVVRVIADEDLTCELAGVPATTHILSKADHLLRTTGQIVTMRELVEACESLPSQPMPARFHAQAVNDHIEMVLPSSAMEGMTKEEVERRFRAAGIPLKVIESAAPEHEAAQIRPLRADLLETTFTAGRS